MRARFAVWWARERRTLVTVIGIIAAVGFIEDYFSPYGGFFQDRCELARADQQRIDELNGDMKRALDRGDRALYEGLLIASTDLICEARARALCSPCRNYGPLSTRLVGSAAGRRSEGGIP
jgi:hypothetical protein